MIIIGSAPVAAASGALTLTQFYSVALLAGVYTVFSIRCLSELPALADPREAA
jgi:hypothetical protein